MNKISILLISVLVSLAAYAGGTSNVTLSYGNRTVFATWDTTTQSAGHFTLSNGDLTITRTALNTSNWRSIRSTIGKASGKWYWEYTYDVALMQAAPLNEYILGVGASSLSSTSFVGSGAQSWGHQSSNVGPLKYNNGGGAPYGSAMSNAGDKMMIALDMDNGRMWFGANGTWMAAGNPATGANPSFTGLTGTQYAAASMFVSTLKITANFGASAFAFTPPSGFNAGLYQ